MKRPSAQRFVEIVASVGSVTCFFLGSTSITGEIVGIADAVPWWALMVMSRMWGLLPLNIGVLAALLFNLWRSLS